MDNLKNILKADTSGNKPKRIQNKDKSFTKKFLKWNKQQLEKGTTSFYAEPSKVYNIKSKILLDKKNLPKNFKNKFDTYQSTITPKDISRKTFRFVYDPNDSSTWNYSDNSLTNNLLLPNLIRKNNITGDYRLIIKNGQNSLIDNNYFIGDTFWRDNSKDFWIDSENMIWNENLTQGDVIHFIFTKEKELPFNYYSQKFLLGVNHCFFHPINEYMTNQLYDAMSTSTKKKYQAKINLIMGKTLKTGERKGGLIEKYSEGVPESDIQEICDILQIGVDIDQPFNDNYLIEYRSDKKPRKVFKFLNTRLDHIELSNYSFKEDNIYKTHDPDTLTFNTIQNIYNRLKEENEFMIFNKNRYGICSIQTLINYYTIQNDFYDSVSNFEYESGLNKCYIDFFKYPELASFINGSLHFNGTVDFVQTKEFKQYLSKLTIPEELRGEIDYINSAFMESEFNNKNIPSNMRHIDMKKAYTQFHEYPDYNGFLGKITDFRKINNFDQKGCYYITNINFSKCNESFIQINKDLCFFQDDNIYYDCELRKLQKLGATFDVLYGAFGMEIDFRFNEEMMTKKDDVIIGQNERHIPYYSKWTGLKCSDSNTKRFFLHGSDKYFQTLQGHSKYVIKYDEEEQIGQIQFPKKYKNCLKHIPAQITAYQRLIMLDQLLKMKHEKLVRICVDGIYYFDHQFEKDKCFFHKTKMTFNNDPADSYLSNMIIPNTVNNVIFPIAEHRNFYKNELFIGAGGNGKTYHNLRIDTGLINVCYIPHSWKLATSQKMDKLNLSVHARLYSENHKHDIERYNNVLVIDECSMLTEYQKRNIMKNYSGKLIFCGDIGFQLPPIVNVKTVKLIDSDFNLREMDTTKFDNIIELKKNYRFKCNKLKQVINYLRNCISTKKSMDFKSLPFKTISKSKLLNDYSVNDMILNYYKDNCYNEMFADKEKYLVKENGSEYKNGEVIYKDIIGLHTEKRHGFTTHSIQGETFSDKIYIDKNSMIKDVRLFYTAISRAQYLEQIYIVE